MSLIALAAILTTANAPMTSATVQAPAIYSNEEQIYFEQEAGKKPPPWIGVIIAPNPSEGSNVPFVLAFVDAFGTRLWPPAPYAEIASQLGPHPKGEQITVQLGGRTIELRRARPASCWVAIPKKQSKPDGRPDWHFVRDVKLHDQGGRALIGGGPSGTDAVVIRMRNVVWPPSPGGKASANKPSIVLYVHKPDQPDRAESYVWADPGASRIGINLRWVQASCTIGVAEAPSKFTFRG